MRPVPQDIVIVAIDEDSLSKLGRWPWPRTTHAKLIQSLASEQPAVIGFDVILAEKNNADLAGDKVLVDAVADAGNIVLPVLIERTQNNGQLIETLPFSDLMAVTADVGSVHTVLDEDSIARSVFRYEGLRTPAWQLFAQAVLNVAYDLPSKNNFMHDDVLGSSLFALVREDQIGVDFAGPPGHFKTISYAQVLAGEFAPGTFNNKIVLVGATAAGMNDMLSTPVSGLSVPMSGVEFHANIIESVRHLRFVREVPPLVTIVLVLVLAVMPLLWMPKLSALKGFLITFCYGIAILLLAGLLPKWLGLWFPPTAALFAISLAYPLWSWRKLEAAQQYLNHELDYLNAHLHKPDIADEKVLPSTFDRFDARIQQVRAATTQLRHLQNDRKETLAFISHDLRAPLKAAINLIEEQPEETTRLQQFLTQAHHLAEDFLQTSRAEMIEKEGFQEIDIVGLVQQTIDSAYDAAREKQIQLVRVVFDGSAWLDGHFGLLERALLNLILNAIKFAPAQTKIEIQGQVVDEQFVFSVTDYGEGIPQKEQAKLFKRFSRLAGQANTEGSGLGLYFVKTVAEKHNGEVRVDSVEHEYTTFTMKLPLTASQPH